MWKQYLLLGWNVQGSGSSLFGKLVHQPDVGKGPTCHHSIISSSRTIGVEFSGSQAARSQMVNHHIQSKIDTDRCNKFFLWIFITYYPCLVSQGNGLLSTMGSWLSETERSTTKAKYRLLWGSTLPLPNFRDLHSFPLHGYLTSTSLFSLLFAGKKLYNKIFFYVNTN